MKLNPVNGRVWLGVVTDVGISLEHKVTNGVAQTVDDLCGRFIRDSVSRNVKAPLFTGLWRVTYD